MAATRSSTGQASRRSCSTSSCRPRGATVYFTLTLAAETASVDVNYVAFEKSAGTPDDNTAFLEAAIEDARIRKTETVESG